MRFRPVIVALFLVSAVTVRGSTAEQQHAISVLYRRGLGGDNAAVIECIDKLEAELKADPANQIARVYLGSAYTLQSRDLGYGPKKLQTLNHGVALMDEAVASRPDDTKVRLARALTTQALPFFTGGAASSRKDFELLATAAERAPHKFEEGDLQIIFYNAGVAAKGSGQRERARALFQQAAKHRVDATLAPKVEAALADL
ncbi:MAG: hypothetical protein ABR526_10580 [Chthoniobacterales bacterium]